MVSDLTINRIFEKMMVAASGCVLVAIVAMFDENARGHISGVLSGQGVSELSGLGARLQHAIHTASQMVGFENIDSTMGMFAVAAVVLLVFMLNL
jgi:hypothetical protein